MTSRRNGSSDEIADETVDEEVEGEEGEDLGEKFSWLIDSSPNQPSTTVMRLQVRVPVLSEQIVVALPIVSQAAKTLFSRGGEGDSKNTRIRNIL